MLSSAARAMCPGCVLAPQSDDQAARVRIPVWRAEADEGRARRRRRRRPSRNSRAPLHRRKCRISRRLSRSHCTTAPPIKMLPSSAYSQLVVQAAGESGDELLFERDELIADVLQQEAAGAVGILRCRRHAGRAGRRAPPADRLRFRRSAPNAGPAWWSLRRLCRWTKTTSGIMLAGMLKSLQQLRHPNALHDVEEHACAMRWS